MSSVDETQTYRVRDDLDFEYLEDSEGDHNRGFQVDKVVAYLNGKEVGHLKISYIPKQRFERHCPGILNYLTSFEGNILLPYGKDHVPWKQIPADDLRAHIYNMALAARLSWRESCSLSEKAKTASTVELMLMVTGLEKLIKKEKGVIFKRYRAYAVDKPVVDWISVHESFRRQGIGTALYRAGFHWMRSKGLPFYASRCQSDYARLAWQSMCRHFKVEQVTDQLPKLGKARVKRLRFAA